MKLKTTQTTVCEILDKVNKYHELIIIEDINYRVCRGENDEVIIKQGEIT